MTGLVRAPLGIEIPQNQGYVQHAPGGNPPSLQKTDLLRTVVAVSSNEMPVQFNDTELGKRILNIVERNLCNPSGALTGKINYVMLSDRSIYTGREKKLYSHWLLCSGGDPVVVGTMELSGGKLKKISLVSTDYDTSKNTHEGRPLVHFVLDVLRDMGYRAQFPEDIQDDSPSPSPLPRSSPVARGPSSRVPQKNNNLT